MAKRTRPDAGIVQQLPQAYRQPLRLHDDATAAIFNRFIAHPTESDFNALMKLTAPLLVITAFKMNRRNPDFYTDVEEMICEGTPALMHEVKRCEAFIPEFFLRAAMRAIKTAIRIATYKRHGSTRYRHDQRRIIERIIAHLRQQFGREPLQDELSESIAGAVGNPRFYSSFRSIHNVSQFEDRGDRREFLNLPDEKVVEPARKMIDRETVRLAFDGLNEADRTMLEMIFDGEPLGAIRSRFRLTKHHARKRIDGLIWQVARRADLARYLDVEPATEQAPATRVRMGLAAIKRGDLPALERVYRTDDELCELLAQGHSQRVLLEFTRGNWKVNRRRISQLQTDMNAVQPVCDRSAWKVA